jgi:hypothetical protein
MPTDPLSSPAFDEQVIQFGWMIVPVAASGRGEMSSHGR